MAPSEHIAHTLLKKAHPPETANALFKDKVLHKPVHLRPTSPDPGSQDARAQRRLTRLRKQERQLRRQKPKPLSSREKRITGIYDVASDPQQYAIYVPLNQMWQDYIREILGITESGNISITVQNAGPMLASADYHGAHLTVVKSRCAGMVGLQGIVIRDTKFTFQFITRKNEVKVIPKRYTVFRFEIPRAQVSQEPPQAENAPSSNFASENSAYIFELNGTQFEHRATDRATKKFKQRGLAGS